MKIPPFKEINSPNKNGYWINKKMVKPMVVPISVHFDSKFERVEKVLKKL